MSEIIDSFTPALDVLTKKYGLVTSAIYGRIWRYNQGKHKACTASYNTLARELGLSPKTIARHVQTLMKEGLVKGDGRTKHQTYRLVTTEEIEITVKLSLGGDRTESPRGGDLESARPQTESPTKREVKKKDKKEKNFSPPSSFDGSGDSKEITYVDAGDEFDEPNEKKRPKWQHAQSDFEREIMSVIPSKNYWNKGDGKENVNQIRMIEESMKGARKNGLIGQYPEGWVDTILEWYKDKHRNGKYIKLSGLVTALKNPDRLAEWISKNLEPAVPGVSDRTTTIEVEMPGSFG